METRYYMCISTFDPNVYILVREERVEGKGIFLEQTFVLATSVKHHVMPFILPNISASCKCSANARAQIVLQLTID